MAIGLLIPLEATPADYQPDTPFTYLFDTGVSSAGPIRAEALDAKAGWKVIAEENSAHRFQGDAVLLNDKLTVVVRAQASGAEVYSKTAGGFRHRAVLMALPGRATTVKGIASFRIAENHLGAVMLEVASRTDDGPCAVAYRLTAGQRVVEIRSHRAADRLFVVCRTRWVVVPDFFADDMVFGPESIGRARLGLPAENFLLSLIRGQAAMVMCVWRSGTRNAYAHLGRHGREKAITACEIDGLKDDSLWVALLEGPRIWHERPILSEEVGREIKLDWKPPFAARWRADFVAPAGIARSSFLEDKNDSDGRGTQLDGHDPLCWIEGDRAVVRPTHMTGSPANVEPPDRTILVYPLDRSRTTPLTVFCPIDVLRETLGVGPCQYILETEGLAAQTSPTPAGVMNWVERQFERGTDADSASEMEELLGQMTHHVAMAQARIDRYAEFAQEISRIRETWQHDAGVSDAAEKLARIADQIGQAAAGTARAPRGAWSGVVGLASANSPQEAADLAARIVALIGREDALAECRQIGDQLRRLGAAQDRALSRCRMAVRWLKQQARMIADDEPKALDLAKSVYARAERLLEGK